MKWIFKFLIMFSSINFVFAQNWLPIDTAKVYNYITDSSNYITRSIATTQNGDTTFFETIVDSINNSDTLFLNQPDFFGYFMLNENDSVYTFYGRDTFILKPLKNIGENWQYSNSKVASIINITTQNFGSTTDSIKIIWLGNTDTLVLSKNYGIVNFQDFVKEKTYKQCGIDNVYGNENLYYDDIFDFNVGDIFQYKESSLSYGSQSRNYRREKILNYTVFQDTITITKEVFSKNWNSIYGLEETVISIDTVNYSYTSFDIDYRHIAGQFIGNEIINKVVYDTIYGTEMKNYIPFFEQIDSNKYIPYDPYSITNAGYFKTTTHYAKGFGRIIQQGETLDYSYEERLIGYYKGIDTVGTIYNDDFYTSIKDVALENMGVSFYPNPTKNQLFIVNKENQELYISLSNTLGQEVYNANINENHSINTQYFNKGIYILKVCTKQGICGTDKVMNE